MPKTPSRWPDFAPGCDMRLPEATLAFRKDHGLTNLGALGSMNMTAWLYEDEQGVKSIQVNPNVTIAQLRHQRFDRQEDSLVEVGFHSEMIAGEWFQQQKRNRQLRVHQIFTERIPCPTCTSMLKAYFQGVPYYYYYDRRSWRADSGGLLKHAGEALQSAYML